MIVFSVHKCKAHYIINDDDLFGMRNSRINVMSFFCKDINCREKKVREVRCEEL